MLCKGFEFLLLFTYNRSIMHTFTYCVVNGSSFRARLMNILYKILSDKNICSTYHIFLNFSNCSKYEKFFFSIFLLIFLERSSTRSRSLISSQICRFDFPVRLLISLCETSRILPRISQSSASYFANLF